jgi:hypothetical protein
MSSPLPFGVHMCVVPARGASLVCLDNSLREDVNPHPPRIWGAIPKRMSLGMSDDDCSGTSVIACHVTR